MRARFLTAFCLALLLAVCVSRAAAGTSAPANRVPPLPCNADTVHLVTPTGVLEGTLLCPTTPAPWPVVLIIAGSGPTDRDGNNAGLPGRNNSLRLLAEALAARGIASLRYDKRGMAGSRAAMKSEADLRFDMFADDAAGWIGQLRGDRRFRTVTVVGHSEGSLAGMLAVKRAGADGFVSIAGVGRSADKAIHDQLAARAPQIAADADRVMAQLKQGKTVDSVPPVLSGLFRPSAQPYVISWFRYEPDVEIRRLGVPVLVAQGTTDIQVSVEDARLLVAAEPSATLVIVDGMNHVLKIVPPDELAQMRSYSDPTLPVAPRLVDAVERFVKAVRR